MENLFSEDPQFRRVQYRKLSDNAREWQEEIGALVSEVLPKDLDLNVQVVFQKVDDEKGYGIGSAIATDGGSGKSIGIPIIIKAWHVAPFDLYFHDGKLAPLTEDNVAKHFLHGSLGVGVASRTPPPNLSDDVFADVRTPPLGGKYAYSAPFSALRLISGTLGAEDLEHFKLAVQTNPRVLAGFHKNNTFEVLCKYAAEKPALSPQDKKDRERTMSVFTVKKDGPNEYRLYSSPDGVYDPVLISTNRRGAKAILEMEQSGFDDAKPDPMCLVDQNGHYTVSPPTEPVLGSKVVGPKGAVKTDGAGDYGAELGEHKSPWVFDPRGDDRAVESAATFGRFGVKDSDGVLAKGWVVPNVVDFDGKAKPLKLFLGKSLSAMQGRIAGIPLPDDADAFPHPDVPETGDIGTLVYRDGDKVVATAAFQVTGVNHYKGMNGLKIVDHHGNHASLIFSPKIDGIIPIGDGKMADFGPLIGPKKNYIVSEKMFFVKMPRLSGVSEGPDDFKSKAAEHLDKNPLKVAMANGRYIFRGGPVLKCASYNGVRKTASVGRPADFDFTNLPRHEAEFLLGAWGLDQVKTAEVLDGVASRIHLEVHHLQRPMLPHEEKVASSNLAPFVENLRRPILELVKAAADFDNAQTVDSVLSLGFINEENVNRFAAARSMLEEVSHMISKLLLAARLGAEDVPEESARAALMHIQRVIDGLGRLRMLGEHQIKTSSLRRPPPKRSPVGGRLLDAFSPQGVNG